jgi:hypothetical protein
VSYGHGHRALRERWRPRVESESAFCWYCGGLIVAGEPWDLSHDPVDPSRYVGPAHAACNRDTRLEKRLRGSRGPGLMWSNPRW